MQTGDRHFSGADDGRIAFPAKLQNQFPAPPRARKLLDHVRDLTRVNHYAARDRGGCRNEEAKSPMRLPVVLTRDEVRRLFAHLHGPARLMAGLLYGSGLRLMECVRLRVKDVDFAYAQITVRDGKGAKDRVTMLPVNLAGALERHLVKVRAQHEQDLEEGFGTLHLPDALARKYPQAEREWCWQYVPWSQAPA